jgi:hypothetical protein
MYELYELDRSATTAPYSVGYSPHNLILGHGLNAEPFKYQFCDPNTGLVWYWTPICVVIFRSSWCQCWQTIFLSDLTRYRKSQEGLQLAPKKWTSFALNEGANKPAWSSWSQQIETWKRKSRLKKVGRTKTLKFKYVHSSERSVFERSKRVSTKHPISRLM